MKALIAASLLALISALAIAASHPPRELEAQLLHLQLARSMPEAAAELAGEPAEVQAIFLAYADDPVLAAKARLALLRHPDMARPILAAFGDQPLFQDVLRRYGEDVVLPIHHFLTNEVSSLELMHGIGATAQSALGAMRDMWRSEPSDETPAGNTELTPHDRAWYAVQFLDVEGYDFLGQFVVDAQGHVAWLQTERVLEGITRFFASGIKGLESKWQRDEPIAIGDLGWAALDVAIGVSALKVLRLGKAGALAGRSLTFSQRSAALGASLWRGSVIGARLVRYGAPVVLAYVAIRHPSVLNSLFGKVADMAGIPVVVAQTAGWMLVLLPFFLLARFVLRPLAWMLAGAGHLLRWLEAFLRGSPGASGKRKDGMQPVA